MDISNKIKDQYNEMARLQMGKAMSSKIDMDIMEGLGLDVSKYRIRQDQQEIIEEHWDEVIKFLKKKHPEDFI